MKRSILGLLVGIYAVCSCSDKKEVVVKTPTRVVTEVASASASNSGQTYVGIVEENEATAVSFTGMGVVKRVLVSEGQTVSRGQLIAEMDDTQARNLLSGAEAQMNQANDALQRYQMLHEGGSLPEVQWVEIQSKVAQARSQLEVARKNLADCRLVAPVSGIVGRKLVGAGETALPSQAVVSIFDISSVKVKVAVPETEVSTIGANTPSTVLVEAIGRNFEGGRIEKGVVADPLTHTYDVRIRVANGTRQLLPGMVASVRFGSLSTLSRGGDALDSLQLVATLPLVPVTAVQRRADGSLFVWTVSQDSTAHRSTVSIGQTVGNRIAVTTGLNCGQRIVTEGYQKLSEGTKVAY